MDTAYISIPRRELPLYALATPGCQSSLTSQSPHLNQVWPWQVRAVGQKLHPKFACAVVSSNTLPFTCVRHIEARQWRSLCDFAYQPTFVNCIEELLEFPRVPESLEMQGCLLRSMLESSGNCLEQVQAVMCNDAARTAVEALVSLIKKYLGGIQQLHFTKLKWNWAMRGPMKPFHVILTFGLT